MQVRMTDQNKLKLALRGPQWHQVVALFPELLAECWSLGSSSISELRDRSQVRICHWAQASVRRNQVESTSWIVIDMLFRMCDNMWLSWEDVLLRRNLWYWTLTSWWRLDINIKEWAKYFRTLCTVLLPTSYISVRSLTWSRLRSTSSS